MHSSKSLLKAQKYLFVNDEYCLTLVDRLIDKGDTSSQVYELKAKCYLNLGCHLLAAECAEMAIKHGGANPSLYTILLEARLNCSDHRYVENLIEKLANSTALYNVLIEDIAQSAHLINQNVLAEKLYLKLLFTDSHNHLYLTRLGAIYQKIGDMDKAQFYYLSAIEHSPQYAIAYNLLANVRKLTEQSNHIDLLKNAFERSEPSSDSYALIAYALGKEYEDLGEYSYSFSHYNAGAQAMRQHINFDISKVKHAFNLTKKYFDEYTAESTLPLDSIFSKKPTPIFVLGMPRTGSTLIDRVLSSHSQVESLGELSCFKESMKRVTNFQGGEGFHHQFYSYSKGQVDFQKLGEIYQQLAKPVNTNSYYFIDKYPMNYMDLGTIAKALPHAKFINTIRNPMSTVFSNFKQIFTHGMYNYSYDQAECAQQTLYYRDLMAFWHKQFPGRILDVPYEEMVGNTEKQTRSLLKFLQLGWDENCLNFHKNKSSVATASVSQVRQPIYKSSVAGWKNYEQFLEPAQQVFSN
ncbi:tetratricopeptide repeat-containing sulfotransferase family protein [Colwellia sp. 20A7]|uniref:tetratricopeptide repeat-containing sulfotransferase family protein n=1 Tax=Colwellia sp. 20A7 TaxID=2689569 RepID=UPI00135B80C6|nr:sulfotransferase [Colwellia sp. 20A7]